MALYAEVCKAALSLTDLKWCSFFNTCIWCKLSLMRWCRCWLGRRCSSARCWGPSCSPPWVWASPRWCLLEKSSHLSSQISEESDKQEHAVNVMLYSSVHHTTRPAWDGSTQQCIVKLTIILSRRGHSFLILFSLFFSYIVAIYGTVELLVIGGNLLPFPNGNWLLHLAGIINLMYILILLILRWWYSNTPFLSHDFRRFQEIYKGCLFCCIQNKLSHIRMLLLNNHPLRVLRWLLKIMVIFMIEICFFKWIFSTCWLLLKITTLVDGTEQPWTI